MSMAKSYLLVDDDKIINFIHTKVINTIDNQSVIYDYQSSVLALDFIKTTIEQNNPLPEYIFIDINMPEISGLMMVAEMNSLGNEHFKNSKVFVVSSTLDNRDKDKALSYPFVTAFVSKPLTIQLLKNLHQQYD